MTTATQAVFLKYVPITPNSTLAKIRPAPSASPASASDTGYASSTGNAMEEEYTQPKGKKRRLDHLTWEEKIQRKKLKNRVAAQTSRDRKKARMEEMEHEIKALTQTTEILQNKCESLQAINDSLLEKNQKLDMELEMMRQQLEELQKQQKTVVANLKSSKSAGTCDGSGINSNGLTVDKRTAAKEQFDGGPLEDCCTLPALQDMLLLDEEFDANKLEELAESLLADISADMETGDRKSNETVAETTSRTERLPRPVVGTTAECLESGKHSTTSSSLSIPEETTTTLQHNALTQEELQTKSDTKISITQMLKLNEATHADSSSSSSSSSNESVTQPTDNYETVYGTYDAKTNSITIVMDDGTVPVNEAVEEIYCDDIKPLNQIDDIYIKYESPVASPSQVYLNVNCATEDENDEDIVNVDDDLTFDPIVKFLRPKQPLISPLAKSPAPSLYSATSDHGYESILGSPEMPNGDGMTNLVTDVDDFAWNSSFNELFPTLI